MRRRDGGRGAARGWRESFLVRWSREIKGVRTGQGRRRLLRAWEEQQRVRSGDEGGEALPRHLAEWEGWVEAFVLSRGAG